MDNGREILHGTEHWHTRQNHQHPRMWCTQVNDRLATHNKELMRAVHTLMRRYPRVSTDPQGAIIGDIVWRWNDILSATDVEPGIPLWKLLALDWYPEGFDELRQLQRSGKLVCPGDLQAVWEKALAIAREGNRLGDSIMTATLLIEKGTRADTGKKLDSPVAPTMKRQRQWLLNMTPTREDDYALPLL